MVRPADAYLFSPKEATKERHEKANGHRRPDQKANPRKTDRAINDHYTVGTYSQAIRRVCKDHGTTPWTPHQLRHSAATLIRKRHGLDGAQAALGHSRADTTEIYAELDKAKAIAVMEDMG